MNTVPYSSVVGSLSMIKYAHTLILIFFVNVLGRYLSDLGQSH